MNVWVAGIGIAGPGLDGWAAAREILARRVPYEPVPTVLAASDWLPAAERRRTGVPVKLALAVGREAFAHAQWDAAQAATVFTSSGGDCENVHQICETLASSARDISPTRFHNSVHNAAAGYWGIATGSQRASTSLCCHDASFAAGLLEAAVQCTTADEAVALIAYDQVYPEPLHSVRPISAHFGVALLLAPSSVPRACGSLEIILEPGGSSATTMQDASLEALRVGVPAARCLPLLAALAQPSAVDITLGFVAGSRLRVRVDHAG